MASEKNKGRPTKYNKEKHPKAAYKLALLGMSNDEIAELMCIDSATLYRWKDCHDEFCEALMGGGALADADVAKSLYERAIGYEHGEEKVFCFQGEIITHQTIKHYPPDTGAAALWLANRQRKRWASNGQDEQNKPLPINVIIGVKDASRKDT